MNELHEFMNRTLFSVSGTPITISTLLVALAIIIASFWVSRLIENALIRFMGRRGVKDVGSVGVASRLMRYVILFIGMTIAFTTMGLNLTALFTAGAVFAVAIGFAMQSITQNFVSGIILLLERTIKPGDILEVEGSMVKVTSLGVRSTVARTLNDEDLIIPNSVLMQTTVKNFTLRDPYFRLRGLVGVTYDSDMKQVRRILEDTASGLDWRVKDRAPVVLLTDFGSSSVDWEVSVWVEDPFSMRSLRSRLYEALWWALADAGVVIAFPQLDVHLDRPVARGLADLSESIRSVGGRPEPPTLPGS